MLAVAALTGLHHGLANALTDLRFRWLARPASGDIVLVAIDSSSIETIATWPWPREIHAELIRRLVAAGARDIVLDVDFSTPSKEASDQAFAEALRQAGGSVVLAAFRQPNGADGTIHYNRPLPAFDAQAWSAVVNVQVEADGRVRRYRLGDRIDGTQLPSMGVVLAGTPDSGGPPFWIDFGIRAETLPSVAYADVLRGDPAALARVAGKKVIVGATALELGDRFSVPNGRILAGPQVQMLAAESLLQHRALRMTSDAAALVAIAAFMLAMAAARRRLGAGRLIWLLAASAAAAEGGAVLVQAQLAIIPDTSLWHLAMAAYLAALALDEIDLGRLLGGIAEKRFQQIAMSLGDGLVCIDAVGRITVWNNGATALFGHPAEEMIGKPLARICSSIEPGGERRPFRLVDLPPANRQASGGSMIELEGHRRSGEAFALEACVSQWQGVDGTQFGAVLRDISERKRESERIRYLAEHDSLTGLANRNSLYERFGASRAAQRSGQQVAVLLLDLDKFKQINDTLGHACGDQLLCAVAARLRAFAQGADVVARMSGDEFAVVVHGGEIAADAARLAARMALAFSREALLGERHVHVNVSVGVAVHPQHGATAEELFGNADLALYQAKTTGRARSVLFEPGIRRELEARLSLEAELSLAVEHNELELFYQPQVSLRDGALTGAEALIRWRHPQRGVIPPARFMPLVNASRFSDRIAGWVLESACRQGRGWQQKGFDLRIGVNLSPSQLRSGALVETVTRTLEHTGFAASLLELEVTEDILLDDHDDAIDMLDRLRAMGARVAFDDFGTGFASLTYLKKYPLDRIKIDRSFVRNLGADASDIAIVHAIIDLGQTLGMSIIAEGIEDADTAAFLTLMGCEEGQGYLYGQPVPAAEFEKNLLFRPPAGADTTDAAASAA